MTGLISRTQNVRSQNVRDLDNPIKTAYIIYMKTIQFSFFLGVTMTNTILKILILISFLGVIFSCLATVPSYGSTALIEIPSDEIEIIFVADK